ncbi:alkaline phosphatase [Stutzerimonas zhaodongensis]|uniref:Alkaline phosphatase n=1 Tax=Stutzerimonas zhaodongensis TaxID=1176257 RepID=A0A3M2HYA2_9GAMM|nr:esterase-like activity of phytase family protein [Stutzerimonas zhaodongensis]MCQ4317163.1 esterase-like activity of phytase family protein [Stutzerimonas zhaodongensis]RMH91892.1 alkaline phosphatase [Stutzerimonas zhaodongensis]
MKIPTRLTRSALSTALTLALLPIATQAASRSAEYFERVATFPVYRNLGADEDASRETVAEITAVSRDGRTLIYTDSPGERIGLVDIRDPKNPEPAGFIKLEGEPTSVAVHHHFVLVAVNTSLSFAQPDGVLAVFDIRNPAQPKRVATLPMGGQPDSIAVSPKGRYAAVAIENERDEDLNDGLLPQLPGGFLRIVDLKGQPSRWSTRDVDLTGLAEVAPEDPEPEYVSINDQDVAAVTLQENNHVVLVDLRLGRVLRHFSAGQVDLQGVDVEENDRIQPVGVLTGKRREPDAIAWVGPLLATANEGDYEDANGEQGGSRGFTLFDYNGQVWHDAGASMEHAFIRAGHYPENRSENKGIEPEGIASASFRKQDFLFVGSERGNAVAVYDVARPWAPVMHQLLPAGMGPEGILPIPARNLLVVSSEEDSAKDGYRSTISIYQYGAKAANYPEIRSTDSDLIPWGALSGLVADRTRGDRLFAVPDSYYKASRIFAIDTSKTPALIDRQIELRKDGSTVDYDLEGIAQAANGDFWLASEGNGKAKPNLLIHANAKGDVLAEYALPENVAAQRTSNGFEGVSVVGEGASTRVYVAFQREWKNDPAGRVRIGVFSPSSGEWAFMHYPLDVAPEGAWVGLSELTSLGNGQFLVIERDNQQGPAAQIKRLYRIDLSGVQPVPEGQRFPLVSKRLERDLLPDLKSTGGWVLDKVEGAAVDKQGRLFVVTDNDGVEDASGETRFMRLGMIKR